MTNTTTIKVCAFWGHPDPDNHLALSSGTEDCEHGVLTTDHAASSYGLPVLVLDGQAIGPRDRDNLHLLTVPERSDDVEGNEHLTYLAGTAELIAAARRAGYEFSTSERFR